MRQLDLQPRRLPALRHLHRPRAPSGDSAGDEVRLRIGSLFSGTGALDLAVQSVYGGDVAWYSDIEPAACTILAAHYPGVPNLGDITKVNWEEVRVAAPVDILTGGYP